MKNIFKKIVLIAFIFFYSFRIASASVVINEIMYDLDDGDIDWVEIYNPDSGDIDITSLKLLISNSTSNHSINNSFGSSVLHSGDYGVIVGSSVLSNYTAKWGTSGNIFTSSFSLPNDTGKVEINNGDKNSPISTLSYQSSYGASSNGKSLQKISDTWQESAPTPGKINEVLSTSETPSIPPISNTNNGQIEVPQNPQNGIVINVLLKNKVVFDGFKTNFQSTVFRDGIALFYGRYFWNFGDGSSTETKVNSGGEVSHIYFYPGEYKLTVEYYANGYGDTPEVSGTLTVKVIGADVLISSVGTEQDFFIELSNNTDKDIDIGKWLLVSGDKRFIFPKNTIISTKKKITFSPLVTGFTFSDKNNLKLVNSDWKTIFDYALSVTPTPPPIVVNNPHPKKITVARSATNSAIAENLTTEFVNQTQALDETPEVLGTSLSAQAISSEIGVNNKKSLYYVVLLLLLLAGGSAVYFIRRSKRQTLETEEDFDILE